MKILLVSATAFEIKPMLANLLFIERINEYLQKYTLNDAEVDILITGIGMMHASFHLSRQLSHEKYDFAINAGICGSFTPELPMGAVTEVTEDRIADLGIEDRDRFLTLFELGLMEDNKFPYAKGKLVNSLPINSRILADLSKVNGITVNTVHGNANSIKRVTSLFSPQVESMEGAAFLYACLLSGVPNAQLRAVSNAVEERDRSRWQVDLAIENLNSVLFDLLEELTDDKSKKSLSH